MCHDRRLKTCPHSVGTGSLLSGCHRFDTMGHPRNLTRHSIAVQDPFGHATLQLGLRDGEGSLRGRPIARGDRAFDTTDEGADPADPVPIDAGPCLVPTDAFARGLMMRHTALLRMLEHPVIEERGS